MIIKGKEIKIRQVFCLALYYGFAQYLPKSNTFGNMGGSIRYLLCRQIFKKCGKHVNIERKAHFASGVDIEIGDFYRIFLEIRNRKKSRTQFLDKLKEKITQMMDELDR